MSDLETPVWYGLKVIKTGKPLEFRIVCNCEGEFCNKFSYYLEEHGETIWLVDTLEKAEFVKNESTEWYNAKYEKPNHRYKAKDLAVFKVMMEHGPT